MRNTRLPAARAAGRRCRPWIQGLGDDLDAYDEVTLELAVDGRVHPLGTTTTNAEGHFLAEVTVPSDLPDGEAYVQLTTRAGWAASLWVHIGDAVSGRALAPLVASAALATPVHAPAWDAASVQWRR